MHKYFAYDVKTNIAKFKVKLKAMSKQDLVEYLILIDQSYCLKIKVKAPRVNNKANIALIDLLSKSWKIKVCDFEIINGQICEYKMLLIKNTSYGYLKNIFSNYILCK